MTRARLLVVGNGMAGLKLIEELLAIAPDRFAITVIGEEPSPAYNRVLLSALLAGEVATAQVGLRPRAWYGHNGITLITGRRAVKLDARAREVVLGDGEVVGFDRLVLATGAQALRLALPGTSLAGVSTLRTIADAADLAAAAHCGAAVVIGGGLLGIEAAHALASAGVEVTLVNRASHLMERQLDAEGADMLKRALEARGIRVLLGAVPRAIGGRLGVKWVELVGTRIACGVVLMAIGVRPACALAASGGLKTNRGILVNDRLTTSAPGIHAIGDCIEHRGVCYGLVEPAYEQARVLARTLIGTAERYCGSLAVMRLKLAGLPVFSAGDILGTPGEHILLRDDGATSYRKLVVRAGRLVGSVLVGDTNEGPWHVELMRARAPIARVRDALAFGRAFAEAA